MKKLAIGLAIISLIVAPKVLADEHGKVVDTETELDINGPIKSQEEFHESEQAEIHENEPFDHESSSPTPTSTATAIATPTESPISTPTDIPTESPTETPTESPLVTTGTNLNSGALDSISNLLKQIVEFLKSLGSHEG